MIQRKLCYLGSLILSVVALVGCGGQPKAKVNMDKSQIPPSAMRYLNMAPPAERARILQQLQQKQAAGASSATATPGAASSTSPTKP